MYILSLDGRFHKQAGVENKDRLDSVTVLIWSALVVRSQEPIVVGQRWCAGSGVLDMLFF